MAKGKGGSGKTYTSKGERRSSIKTPNKDAGQRMLNQIKALYKGKNVVWNLPNVSKDGKVLPNTKIAVNGKEFLNNLKNMQRGQKEVEA
jgi:hypothetical protein